MTATTRSALAQAFAEALKKSGMTQRELANKAGVTEAAVSRLIKARQRSNPQIATLAKIAVALGAELRITFEPRKGR